MLMFLILIQMNDLFLSYSPNVVLDRKRALRTKRCTDKDNMQGLLDNTTGSDTDGMWHTALDKQKKCDLIWKHLFNDSLLLLCWIYYVLV